MIDKYCKPRGHKFVFFQLNSRDESDDHYVGIAGGCEYCGQIVDSGDLSMPLSEEDQEKY